MILAVKFKRLATKKLKAAESTIVKGLVFESKYRYDDGYALAERLVSSKATAAV